MRVSAETRRKTSHHGPACRHDGLAVRCLELPATNREFLLQRYVMGAFHSSERRRSIKQNVMPMQHIRQLRNFSCSAEHCRYMADDGTLRVGQCRVQHNTTSPGTRKPFVSADTLSTCLYQQRTNANDFTQLKIHALSTSVLLEPMISFTNCRSHDWLSRFDTTSRAVTCRWP